MTAYPTPITAPEFPIRDLTTPDVTAPTLTDGPPIPADLNLSEVFAAAHSDWKATATPDGTLNWTSPAGKHYATDPATRISPHLQQAPPPAPEPPIGRIIPDPWTSATTPNFDAPNVDNPNPVPF
ncbi:hypothetical protein E3O06_13045 [Cryobacterium glaciale]|uniref:Uncharacterized protein n=1 Tax=Cryobacterium glaciale TaxID=1259145 RepID=A0A4V3I7V9_9MICO|nr:hypothetical protein [Cryobacterium glaciale]TFB71279.1 hypothetical protein E3O06_13045 [Cryobacterium glaciale]